MSSFTASLSAETSIKTLAITADEFEGRAPPAYYEHAALPFPATQARSSPTSAARARRVCYASLAVNLIFSLSFLVRPSIYVFVVYVFLAIPLLVLIPDILDYYVCVEASVEHDRLRRAAGQLICNVIIYGELAALGFFIIGCDRKLWFPGGLLWLSFFIAGSIGANLPWEE